MFSPNKSASGQETASSAEQVAFISGPPVVEKNGPTLSGQDGSSSRSEAQDRGWAWVVAFASMVVLFLSDGSIRALSLLIVELTTVYDEPARKFGLIFTFAGIAFCFSAVLSVLGLGVIFHERALVAFSGLIACSGFIVVYFSTSLDHVLFLGFCTGLQVQITAVTTSTLLGVYFKKRLSIANGIARSGVSLTAIILPPIIQWMFEEYTYRGAALILAAISLNAFVCAALMLPIEQNTLRYRHYEGLTLSKSRQFTQLETQTDASCFQGDQVGLQDDGTRQHGRELPQAKSLQKRHKIFFFVRLFRQFAIRPSANNGHTDKLNRLKDCFSGLSYFKDPSFVIFQFFVFSSEMAAGFVVQFYPAFAVTQGIPAHQVAYLLPVLGVADLLSRMTIGCIGDYVNRTSLIIVPQLVMGAACFLSVFAAQFWSVLVFGLVIGLTYGVNYLFLGPVLIDYFGIAGLSRTYGIANIVSGMALTIGGPLVGHVKDVTGSYVASMQMLGAFIVVSASCLTAVKAWRWNSNRIKIRRT